MYREALKLILTLATFHVVAADYPWPCEVCLHGKCLVSDPTNRLKTIHLKEPVQAVLDYKSDLFYYDTGDSLKRFVLPYYYDYRDAFMLIITKPWTQNNTITLDQVTGELYYYSSEPYSSISKYKYEWEHVYEISIMPFPKLHIHLHKMWAFNGTIYFTNFTHNRIQEGLTIYKQSALNELKASLEAMPSLKNITIYDIVFEPSGTMYIKSKSQLYKLKVTEGTSKLTPVGDLIDPEKILLSGSLQGALYVFDTSTNLIYVVDPVTDELKKVGSIPSHRLKRIDKKKMIIHGEHVLFAVSGEHRDNVLEYYWKSDFNCEDGA